MAIFSACSDLQTRQLSWVPRHSVTDVQYDYLDSSAVIANSYHETFADDVVTVTFE